MRSCLLYRDGCWIWWETSICVRRTRPKWWGATLMLPASFATSPTTTVFSRSVGTASTAYPSATPSALLRLSFEKARATGYQTCKTHSSSARPAVYVHTVVLADPDKEAHNKAEYKSYVHWQYRPTQQATQQASNTASKDKRANERTHLIFN